MNIRFKRNTHLERLHKILHYDIIEAAPAPFLLAPGALGSLGMMSVIFSTPVILWQLFCLKRYGWLLTFFLVVGIPFIAVYFFTENSPWQYVFMLLPLLTLIIYYFILRITIQSWKEPLFINKPGSDNKL